MQCKQAPPWSPARGHCLQSAALQHGLVHYPQRCFHFGMLLSKITSLILPSSRLIIRGFSLLMVSVCCLFVFHPDVNSSDMLKETKWVYFRQLILGKDAMCTSAMRSDPVFLLRACGQQCGCLFELRARLWCPLCVEVTWHTVWAERLSQPREKQHPTSIEQYTRKTRKPNKMKNTLQISLLWLSLPSFLDSGYSWAHVCALEISEVTPFQM